MGLLDYFRTSPVTATREPETKAMTGSGAYALEYGGMGTSWWLGNGRWDNPKGMARAQALSHANPWMEKAERLVSGRVASLPWHLEDGDDNTVDDEANPALRAVRDLLERPNPMLTWRQLITLTARHMGVCNVGAWYLDELDPYGIPKSILYLNPARLTPAEDGRGILRGWVLDAESEHEWGRGTPLALDEVLPFVLQPPDTGYFGVGLVETAEQKARLSASVDRFTTQTLASGGRRGSFIMPREGRLPDDVYDGLVASMKNVRESPDAAKRDIVTKAPLDITPQASTPQELQAAAVMDSSRNDILLIWGIDIADAGIPGGAGLSSGQLRSEARQSTWENAVEPRVDVIQETIQYRLLDRWKDAGVVVELEFDRPQFQDETPAYERAMKAIQLPLRNWERRQILGLDPFGIPELDNAVWLPAGISEAYMTPDEDGNMPVPPVPQTPVIVTPTEQPMLMEGEVPMKASPLGRTRATVEARITPAIRRAVAKVLADQRDDVVRLAREKAAHLAGKPGDIRAVFNEARFQKALADAIEPHLRSTSDVVATEAKRAIGHLNPAKADPPTFLDTVTEYVVRRGGERLTKMTETTRDGILRELRAVVSAGTEQGIAIPELADRLTDAIGAMTEWDAARAETIARTETMFAYNDAALSSYREYGVERVEAIDGDEDTECANRNGQTFTLDESLSIADHPNGTLDWLPVIA